MTKQMLQRQLRPETNPVPVPYPFSFFFSNLEGKTTLFSLLSSCRGRASASNKRRFV